MKKKTKNVEVKPGYYIDIMDDIVIVYPSLAYEVFNIYAEDFVEGSQDLTKGSGQFLIEYLGKL